MPITQITFATAAMTRGGTPTSRLQEGVASITFGRRVYFPINIRCQNPDDRLVSMWVESGRGGWGGAPVAV